jgi:hypothetical protein
MILSLVGAVAACGGSGGSAPAAPSTPASLTRVAGDNQTAPPRAAVATAPRVIVLGAGGEPVPGVTVEFRVTGGGGSVGVTAAQTDAAGQASCGEWVVGPSAGLNTVEATVQGLQPVTFGAKAARSSPLVDLSSGAPADGTVVGDAPLLGVQITSTFQIATVIASAGGPAAALTFDGPRDWLGTLPLGDRPRGRIGIVITATDVMGNVSDVVLDVVHDRPPVISATAPVEGAVLSANVLVDARCTDDDPAGCVSLVVRVATTEFAREKEVVSRTIDFSAVDGLRIDLEFVALDSAGNRSTVLRHVYIDSSPQVTTLAELPGAVWDVAGSRVLYLDVSGAVPTLAVRNLVSGATVTVDANAYLVDPDGIYQSFGLLTPTGALYVPIIRRNGFPWGELFEWRAGTVSNISSFSGLTLRVAGNWAIYVSSAPVAALWLRDLGAGTSGIVSVISEVGDVAENGDVAFAGGNDIFRFRVGTVQRLTNDPPGTVVNRQPVTDGINVVYSKDPTAGPSAGRIAMHDGTTETLLTPPAARPLPGTTYAAGGGFVAYAMEDALGTRQIWRRGPQGDRQLTVFAAPSAIDAMGPDGTVILNNSRTGRRYRATPGSALQDAGAAFGRVIQRDGRFLVVIGNTVRVIGP